MKDKTTTFIIKQVYKFLDEQIEKAKLEGKSEKDLIEICEKLTEIDFEGIQNEMIREMASDTTIQMRNSMHEKVILFRAEDQEFLAKHEQDWSKAFVASESMYMITLEAAESYVASTKNKSEEQLEEQYYTFNALLNLHARALQQFLEIITLMKNGFADGAYARWRSMYELTITASFIHKYGEPVAKAFIMSAETNDRYEWARSSGKFAPKKRYISFSDIQKECSIPNEIWEQQYILANRIVHASPQGTFGRLCHAGGEDAIHVGRTNYGLTTPAEHSAISLAQITTLFFSIHGNGDAILAIKYINNWVDVIREEYFKAHDSIFEDEKNLWDDSMISYENMQMKSNE